MSRFKASEAGIRWPLLAATSVSILIVALIFIFLGKEALPFVRHPGLSELWGDRWVPLSFQKEYFGLGPLIVGSLLVTCTSLAIAVPSGLCTAIYLAELARPWERRVMLPLFDVLATIPTVVLGFFGLVVLSPWMKQFFGLVSGMSALSASLLLALMAVPTVVSVSEDAIRSVPGTLQMASLAVGASRLQTLWRVTVPAAAPGITAAVVLAMGRVIGETMTVIMVTGNAPVVTVNPLESVRTMTATIALEMGEVPLGSDHYRALFCIGVVLLGITFGLNLMAQRAWKRQRRHS